MASLIRLRDRERAGLNTHVPSVVVLFSWIKLLDAREIIVGVEAHLESLAPTGPDGGGSPFSIHIIPVSVHTCSDTLESNPRGFRSGLNLSNPSTFLISRHSQDEPDIAGATPQKGTPDNSLPSTLPKILATAASKIFR